MRGVLPASPIPSQNQTSFKKSFLSLTPGVKATLEKVLATAIKVLPAIIIIAGAIGFIAALAIGSIPIAFAASAIVLVTCPIFYMMNFSGMV